MTIAYPGLTAEQTALLDRLAHAELKYNDAERGYDQARRNASDAARHGDLWGARAFDKEANDLWGPLLDEADDAVHAARQAIRAAGYTVRSLTALIAEPDSGPDLPIGAGA